jgi:hypothetical protein
MATTLKAYESFALNSEVTTIAELDERLFEQDYEFIFWHMSEVKYLTDTNTAKEYYTQHKDHILSFRAFNKDSEYYLWKNGSQLTGRFRKDTVAADGDNYAIDTEMLLRSIVVPEKRGGQNEQYFLKSRNYISNDDFGYTDSRFVQILRKTN